MQDRSSIPLTKKFNVNIGAWQRQARHGLGTPLPFMHPLVRLRFLDGILTITHVVEEGI